MGTLADTRHHDAAAVADTPRSPSETIRAQPGEHAAAADGATIERDLRLVDAAIALVHAGAAVRVTVANLHLVAAVEDAARARASLRGLRATASGSEVHGAGVVVIEREPAD